MTVTVRSLTPSDAEAIVGMHDNFMAYLAQLGDPDAAVKHFTVERYLAVGFGPDPLFARCIAELMSYPERRRRMGNLGRERIESALSWPHQAPRLLAAYEKLGFSIAPDVEQDPALSPEVAGEGVGA